jgi:mannose-6-phosphate isomerase-like protein (cupin superfamily)
MFESVQPPHSRGPELHYHKRMTEMFWVVEGVIHIEAGEQSIDAPAGSFALVPPGTLHRFHNPLETPSTMLIMFSPGDQREHYFEGMAEFASRETPPTREEVLNLMHQYDQYIPGE